VGHLKIFFSNTTGPILTRVDTNHPWVKEFKFVQRKRIAPLEGEIIDNSERVKMP
jgi:hypothetical protein